MEKTLKEVEYKLNGNKEDMLLTISRVRKKSYLAELKTINYFGQYNSVLANLRAVSEDDQSIFIHKIDLILTAINNFGYDKKNGLGTLIKNTFLIFCIEEHFDKKPENGKLYFRLDTSGASLFYKDFKDEIGESDNGYPYNKIKVVNRHDKEKVLSELNEMIDKALVFINTGNDEMGVYNPVDLEATEI